MELAEFLLARIAEDEVLISDPGTFVMSEKLTPIWFRQKAECEAKRKIVELHAPTLSHPVVALDGDGHEVDLSEFDVIVRTRHVCLTCNGIPDAPCETLRALAPPYADHPDYQPEWRS